MPEQSVRKLRLLSPVGAEAAEYEWPFVVSNKYNPASEILETIRLVCEEFPDLKIALEKNVLNYFDCSSYESMKLVFDKYNKVINGALQMWKGTSIQTEKRPNTDLLRHIIQMCYNFSVLDPDKLNKFYEPFSPEVYGETSFEFVQQMVDQIGFNENEVFVDLGSGVGQVVLHVAAASNCSRCIGIEKADIPATYAETLSGKFRFWLNWYGRKYSDFEIYRGDFFNEEFAEMIKSASFIFVNNFAFGPSVNHRLKSIFENLQDGARILSSREFCSLNFRITDRNLNDIGAIVKVSEITPIDMSVSWTHKPVSYFLHTIDRRKLEHYFAKQNRIKNLDKKALKSFNKNHGDDDDEAIPSKWTRKAWLDYHNNDGNKHGVSSVESARNRGSSLSSDSITSHLNGTCNMKKKATRGRPRKVPPVKTDLKIEIELENSETTTTTTTTTSSTIELFKEELEVKENVVEHSSVIECTPSVRRPGRPKKNSKKPCKKRLKGINHSNLNFLHEQTLRSIEDMSVIPTAAPGCVEQKLCSTQYNLCSVPKIEVTNDDLVKSDHHLHSPLISPLNGGGALSAKAYNESKLFKPHSLDELFAHYKSNMIRFNNYIKTEQFKQDLLVKIENAKKLKEELTAKENRLNTEVYEVKYNLLKNLKTYFAHFKIESFTEFLSKISDLSAVNSSLEIESTELDQQLSLAEREYKTLLQLKTKMIEAENEKRKAFALAEQQAARERAESKQEPKEEAMTKVNYKELKYKKYLTQPRLANKKLSTDSEHSTDLPDTQNTVENNDGDANSIKLDASRINSMIYKVLNEPSVSKQQQQPLNQPPVPTTECSVTTTTTTASAAPVSVVTRNPNPPKAPAYKSTRGRKPAKVKNEKIKTKNGRELIFSSSAGFPSTQVVSKLNSKDPTPPPPPPSSLLNGEKPNQAIKLKINCKESKVKIFNGNDEIDFDSNNNKRKVGHHTAMATLVPKKPKSEPDISTNEPRVPMLKLRASGKHYKTIMVNESGHDPQQTPPPSEQVTNVNRNTANPEHSPNHIKSNAQPRQQQQQQLNEDSLVDHNTKSPASSIASSRSSSVDSSTHSSSSSVVKKSRSTKSRSMARNSQPITTTTTQQQYTNQFADNASGQVDSFYPPSNQSTFPCPNLSLASSTNFISNYPKQLNYMSIAASKNESNRSASILGKNGSTTAAAAAAAAAAATACFNSTNFFPLNKNYFNGNETNGKDFYNGNNGPNSAMDSFNYPYPMNGCRMDGNAADLPQQSFAGSAGGGAGATAAATASAGFDYSTSLNCRYDNAAMNYMSNAANHLETLLKSRPHKNNASNFC